MRLTKWVTLRSSGFMLAVVLLLGLSLTLRNNGTGPIPDATSLDAHRGRGDRPNVLFITIDSLSAKYVGSYGNQRIKTPNLDRLAATGVRFSMEINSFSQTNPSLASIFTSSYPATNKVRVQGLDRLGDSPPTLASLLAIHGYNTAAIYSSRGLDPETSGLERGFDVYQPAYVPVPNQQDIWRQFDGRAEVTTEAAISWMKANPRSPFFLWVHYEDPHYPYTPPPPFDTMYDDCYDCAGGGFETVDRIGAGEALTERDIAHIMALYQGEISHADHELGRLLEAITNAGYMSNTMVVLTADEGQSLHDNGLWFHPNIVYNTVLRVPLVITYPESAPQGMEIKSVTRSIDIMPTILGTLGISSPPGSEGESLWPIIRGEEIDDCRLAFAEGIYDGYVAVVSKKWKLIRDNSTRLLELYDLEADPEELHNLAWANPDTAAQLEQQLKDWMDGHGIPYK